MTVVWFNMFNSYFNVHQEFEIHMCLSMVCFFSLMFQGFSILLLGEVS